MKIKLEDFNNGELTKILRDVADLTQEELAKKIGKHRKSIEDYECNKYCFNMNTFRKILEVCNLTCTIETKKK